MFLLCLFTVSFAVQGFSFSTFIFLYGVYFSSWCVQGLSLSSSPPSSEDGIISVCPATTVTLTCSASGVGSIAWRDQNGQIDGFLSSESQSSVIKHSPYTLTLVSIERNDGDPLANFTSTLEVMVDNITNGTIISCAIFQNQQQLHIYQKSIIK